MDGSDGFSLQDAVQAVLSRRMLRQAGDSAASEGGAADSGSEADSDSDDVSDSDAGRA